jgi:WD40 repeat protein
MATPPLDGDMTGALVSGRAGLVAVESVAAHPARPLVAAGYANGQILLVQIGGRDELLVRPGGSAVTALGWSADGHHLAAIGADGMVSITAFPDRMFK